VRLRRTEDVRFSPALGKPAQAQSDAEQAACGVAQAESKVEQAGRRAAEAERRAERRNEGRQGLKPRSPQAQALNC